MKVDQDARTALTDWQTKQGMPGDIITASLNAGQKAELEKLSSEMDKADSENTAWLKKLVENHGWPTKTQVGFDGAVAAWILVQHSDAEPKFQRKCLDRMVKLPKDEVSQANVAYLTDRVLLHEGKKQIYGTQYIPVDGRLQPRPLEDEANVDRRRAEVGLPPLAENIKEAEKYYGFGPK